MEEKFDPTNVQRYFGKTFVIDDGSEYSITVKGELVITKRFPLRIEGSEIELIAGVDFGGFIELENRLIDPTLESKAKMDDFIRQYGQEPQLYLFLALSLKPEYARRTGLIGDVSLGEIIKIK